MILTTYVAILTLGENHTISVEVNKNCMYCKGANRSAAPRDNSEGFAGSVLSYNDLPNKTNSLLVPGGREI